MPQNVPSRYVGIFLHKPNLQVGHLYRNMVWKMILKNICGPVISFQKMSHLRPCTIIFQMDGLYFWKEWRFAGLEQKTKKVFFRHENRPRRFIPPPPSPRPWSCQATSLGPLHLLSLSLSHSHTLSHSRSAYLDAFEALWLRLQTFWPHTSQQRQVGYFTLEKNILNLPYKTLSHNSAMIVIVIVSHAMIQPKLYSYPSVTVKQANPFRPML